MGFTTLTDLDCVKTYAIGGVDKKTGKKNPTTIEGYYLGTKKVESQKSKTGFAMLHVFQTAQGNHGVWGKTNLDQKMPSVTPGTMTRVTFTGMQKTKNNDMYKYLVQVDTDNMIDVAQAVDAGTEEGGQEEETQQYEEQGSEEAEAGYEDAGAEEEETPADAPAPARAVAPKAAAKAPSAEAVNKVKAMLANRKKSA